MSIFIQILLNSIIIGAIYAVIASGFSLIYSICKFVNFAHGGVILIAAYSLYYFYSVLEYNFILVVIFTVVLAGSVGYLLNLLIYKKLRKRKASNSILLIASLAVLSFFEALIQILFNADFKVIRLPIDNKILSMWGANITVFQIFIFLVSIFLFLLFFILMKYTKIGKSMRAVADNITLARIMGISIEKVYSYVFFIGSLIAGLAGVLISLEQSISPNMGLNLAVKGLVCSIIGGMGSIYGAVLGSFFLGFSENIGAWILPSGYKESIAFIFLIIFLLFRRKGIADIKEDIYDV